MERNRGASPGGLRWLTGDRVGQREGHGLGAMVVLSPNSSSALTP